MPDLIEIDGSHGEGGGQMMRSAVSISLLTGLPFRMTSIRAGRSKPGLKAQHMSVLDASSRVFGSIVAGASLGAQQVTFHPGHLRGADFSVDIGTAGSITLLLQALLPALLFAPGSSVARLRGGTDVSMSPTWDYLREVILPPAAGLAQALDVDFRRRGFYPKGGGDVSVSVHPRFSGTFAQVRQAVRAVLPPLDLTGVAPLSTIDAYSIAHTDLTGRRVAERQLDGAKRSLPGTDLREHFHYAPAASIGSAITLIARRADGAALGASALGEKGRPAEDVGGEAATILAREIATGAPVDDHLADHLVFWLAIRGGRFRASAVTDHTRTNCWLIERFLGPTFEINERERIVLAS